MARHNNLTQKVFKNCEQEKGNIHDFKELRNLMKTTCQNQAQRSDVLLVFLLMKTHYIERKIFKDF